MPHESLEVGVVQEPMDVEEEWTRWSVPSEWGLNEEESGSVEAGDAQGY